MVLVLALDLDFTENETCYLIYSLKLNFPGTRKGKNKDTIIVSLLVKESQGFERTYSTV